MFLCPADCPDTGRNNLDIREHTFFPVKICFPGIQSRCLCHHPAVYFQRHVAHAKHRAARLHLLNAFNTVHRKISFAGVVVRISQSRLFCRVIDYFEYFTQFILGPETIFVAGGGEVYRAAWARLDGLEITEVNREPIGDVTFPPIEAGEWAETAREEHDGFSFVSYRRLR